ncbi:MAG: YhjD/YihY/BrkB family envelope integrity protein [Parvibaculaceae bacterium]|nr:YhjD/YihY/BrkB family envelope integrity protein [Parvibaculaceae bacterium]
MRVSFNLIRHFYSFVWETPLEGMARGRAALVETLRIIWVITRDLIEGRLGLRAVSLVYTTLLSFVPAIAVAFAVFRMVGYHVYLQRFMLEFLSPLGDQGIEITQTTMRFVERVNSSVLGTVGFAFLIYTVISMVMKIEESFNTIWRARNSRSIIRQLRDFVSFGVAGPLFLLMSIGVIASFITSALSITGLGPAPIKSFSRELSRYLPYAIAILAFAALYKFVPNTRVRTSSAFLGATVAGILWTITGWGFASFVANSTSYAVIYSAFAALFFFMIWLYVGWLILLVGCSVSFYFQNRKHLSPVAGVVELSPQQMERIGTHALLLIHEAYERGEGPLTEEDLSSRLLAPVEAMEVILAAFLSAHLIARAEAPAGRYLPSRAASQTSIGDAIQAIRQEGAERALPENRLAHNPAIEELFQHIAAEERKRLGDISFADLLEADQRDEPAGQSSQRA